MGGALNGFDSTVKSITSNMETGFDCNMENPFSCTNLFPADANLPTSLPMPTRCWVGFQPTLGDQNNLGCSGADTCIDSDGVTLIACAACQGSSGVSAFGCDSITKLCSCNLAPTQSDSCTSNDQCQLSSMGCQFTDPYLQPTFGSIPCSSCSNQPVCLIKGGSLGTCSCLIQQVTPDTCSPQDIGKLISPDPTQACLVSLGLSTSSSSSYSADYHSLAMAPCSILNGGSSYCLTVYLSGSTTAPMVVGLSLLTGRRRLLAIQDSNIIPTINRSIWFKATEPCKSLMLWNQSTIYRDLGPVDLFTRSECDRWYSIGSIVISKFNLTSLDPIQFTSGQLLVERLLTDPEALRQISSVAFQITPIIMGSTHTFTPVILIVRNIIKTFSPLINITLTKAWNNSLINQKSNQNFTSSQFDSIRFPFTHHHKEQKKQSKNQSISTNSKGRKILSVIEGWKDELSAVQSLSVSIADQTNTNNVMTSATTIADYWNQGPFQWPPNYNYWTAQDPCVIGTIIWNVTYFTLQTTTLYYTNEFNRPPVQRTFTGCLPQVSRPNNSTTKTTTSTNDTWTQKILGVFKSLLQWMGLGTQPIIDYVSSNSTKGSQFAQDLHSTLTCDLRSVQLCTSFKRSLGWGSIVVLLGFVIVATISRYLSIPYIEIFLFSIYVPVIFLYVFGISPLCVPLIPTCFLLEFQLTIEALLPTTISWPDNLQAWPGCATGSPAPNQYSQISPGTSACFRDCQAYPFGYKSFENNIAWILLNISPSGSNQISNWINQYWTSYEQFTLNAIDLQLLSDDIQAKQSYLNWPDMASSQTICALLTGANLVPLIMGLAAVVGITLTLLAIPFIALQALSGIVLSILTYVHTR